MGHVRTLFDSEFRVGSSIFGTYHIPYPLRHHTSHHHKPGASNKLETTYFSFGGFDWNLALYPYGIKDGHAGDRVSLYLNRYTGFDHQCRVRYSIVLGDGDRRVDSGIVDDVSDSDGKSYGWHPTAKFSDLIYKGVIRVHVEMLLANTLSDVISSITPDAGSQPAPLATTLSVSQCYDRDKQAWVIKSDCHSDSVRLHMVYKDIHNVPRNHLRYVCWTAYLLRYHSKNGHVEPVRLPGAPFSHYYAQEVSDEGIIIETDISIKELREPGCPYLTAKGQLRVQVEWADSYLLFQATYHKYDDVTRLHCQQMRREITALQAENYSLERQLFSYQKSIAYAHSARGPGYGDDGTPDGDPRDDGSFFEDRHLLDRSLSTDTEYA
nr:PREDICTED: uncharacterized protein LOC109038201 [Bemisia tabaci]